MRKKMKSIHLCVLSLGGYFMTYSFLRVADGEELSPTDFIVGGSYANVREAPYQAILLRKGRLVCGASIISQYWLVSAAHCIELPLRKHLSIRTGAKYISGDGDDHAIEKLVIHPGYNPHSNDNDISLIKIRRPIVFSVHQRPIRPSNRAPKLRDEMIISGFGKTGNQRGISKILKLAVVPVVEERSCRAKYAPRDPITENMFCAGLGDTDSCQGDSGGPGVINGQLAGIVSSGMDCASDYYPGVYTKVHRYYRWICRITGISYDRLSR